MAVPDLVTTPGAASANAYCTLAEFNAYCESHVAGAAALAKTDDQKKQAILQATRELDTYVTWSGAPTTIGTQALAWPRCGLYMQGATFSDPASWQPIASNEIPVRLKNACAEQARILLATGDRATGSDQQEQGIARVQVASIEVEFNRAALPVQVIAPSAWTFVSAWGTLAQSNRGGPVPLMRM